MRDYRHPGEDADETENPVYGLPQKHREDGGEAGNVWRHMNDRLPLRTTNCEMSRSAAFFLPYYHFLFSHFSLSYRLTSFKSMNSLLQGEEKCSWTTMEIFKALNISLCLQRLEAVIFNLHLQICFISK